METKNKISFADSFENIKKVYLYAFCIPSLLLLLVFIGQGIFPFGDRSYMRIDMYHQYVPFFSEFWHKMRNMESLYYTNHVGMGSNFWSIYAYYLASPLNIFGLLLPQEYIIEFMGYMLIIKSGLASLFFVHYLKQHSGKNGLHLVMFGMFYALSGFMLAYAWNVMWVDVIMLFPLLCLYFERMLRGGSGLPYAFILGTCIFSNYYMSIMVCLFLVIYYPVVLIGTENLTISSFRRATGKFILYSLLAGALAGLLIVPQVYSLQTTASGEFSFPKKFEQYFTWMDMLVRHLTMLESKMLEGKEPNIYSGLFLLLLLPLYYMNGRIRLREKVSYSILLLILVASFCINVFDYIWHGFHFPNSLPARNSFLYIFLVLYMGFRAMEHIEFVESRAIYTSLFVSVVFVLLCQKLIGTEQKIHFGVYYLSLALLCAYGLLLAVYQKTGGKTPLLALLFFLLYAELAGNAALSGGAGASRSAYLENTSDIRFLLQKIDDPFYRYERIKRKTRDDGAFMNYNSVSIFSSTAYERVSKFLKGVGNDSSTNIYSIHGQTPLLDSLLAVRYGIYEEEQDSPYLKSVADANQSYIYENPYVLPLGFVDYHKMGENWNRSLGNPIAVQNDLSELLVGAPILKQLSVDEEVKEFSFTAEEAGQYYAHIPDANMDEIEVHIDGRDTKTLDNMNRRYLIELGYLQPGTQVRITQEGDKYVKAKVYRFHYEILERIYEKLSPGAVSMKQYEAGKISLQVNAAKRGDLFLSVPYDKSWKIEVDGYPSSYYAYMDTFIGIPLAAGEHEIVMRYEPEGLRMGVALSLASFLTLAFIGILSSRLKKEEFI